MGERPAPDHEAVPEQRVVDVVMSRPLSEAVITDAVVWGLIDAAPDGLLMVDDAGRVLLVNSRLEDLFGYDRGELLGQPVEMLLPEGTRAAHVAHRGQFAEHPRARPMGTGLALRGRRRDGQEFPVEISLSPLPTPEGTWVIAAVRDGSDREQAERGRQAAAIVQEYDRIAFELGDTVIRGLFSTGLRLQGLLELADGPVRAGLESAITDIDLTIREVRSAVFGLTRRANRTDAG